MLPLAMIFLGLGILWGKFIAPQASHREGIGVCLGLGAYSILRWEGPITIQPELAIFIPSLRILIAACLIYFLFMLGWHQFTSSQRIANPSKYILPLLGIASICSRYGLPPALVIFGKSILVISSLASAGLLCSGWVFEYKKGIRPVWAQTLSLFLILPSIWIMVDNHLIELLGYSFELLCTIEIAAVAILLLMDRTVTMTPANEAADITPSIRIAHSGVQVLNHSFKNKLLTMEMSVGTIKNKLPEADSISMELTLIEKSIEHLKQMVNRLRERTKEISLHEQSISLKSILDETVSELKPLLPQATQIQTDDSLLAILLCDGTHLKEVFHNIIRNSIEALGVKGGLIRIYTDPPLPGNWLTICVEDSGPGIPSISLSRVFEPYFTTKAGVNNYGLGLSYCYNVMKASSGSIKIVSSPDKGTTVILSFNPKKIIVYPHRNCIPSSKIDGSAV
jgi:signal transduction histidine kinase